nr:hypothetical protein [Candidatus Njordarchaeota archaeon]
MKFIEREDEIFKALRGLTEAGLDFVVVGGYAVSGLARHRFSVDCDIVAPKRELGGFERILNETGFSKHIEKAGFDEKYGGEFVSYKRNVGGLPVTFDLLVNALVGRETEAAWSFDYVKEHSSVATITGVSTSVNCRIPERELLIAFKIHSARKSDVRDIVMLAENSDLDRILRHLMRGKIEILRGHIDKVMQALNDPNLVDSLKGVFTMTASVMKQIENARKALGIISGRV